MNRMAISWDRNREPSLGGPRFLGAERMPGLGAWQVASGRPGPAAVPLLGSPARTRDPVRSVASKIFVTFAIALAAFAGAAGFGATRLHALGQDLQVLSEGYLPLTRIAAQLDVKDWVTSRVLEAGAETPNEVPRPCSGTARLFPPTSGYR